MRELLAEGWRPIFAHPEMILFLWESEEELLPASPRPVPSSRSPR
ncbi:MAG: hypothetical protein R2862_02890 [Thermoanaerobaculia bacterium]